MREAAALVRKRLARATTLGVWGAGKKPTRAATKQPTARTVWAFRDPKRWEPSGLGTGALAARRADRHTADNSSRHRPTRNSAIMPVRNGTMGNRMDRWASARSSVSDHGAIPGSVSQPSAPWSGVPKVQAKTTGHRHQQGQIRARAVLVAVMMEGKRARGAPARHGRRPQSCDCGCTDGPAIPVRGTVGRPRFRLAVFGMCVASLPAKRQARAALVWGKRPKRDNATVRHGPLTLAGVPQQAGLQHQDAATAGPPTCAVKHKTPDVANRSSGSESYFSDHLAAGVPSGLFGVQTLPLVVQAITGSYHRSKALGGGVQGLGIPQDIWVAQDASAAATAASAASISVSIPVSFRCFCQDNLAACGPLAAVRGSAAGWATLAAATLAILARSA